MMTRCLAGLRLNGTKLFGFLPLFLPRFVPPFYREPPPHKKKTVPAEGGLWHKQRRTGKASMKQGSGKVHLDIGYELPPAVAPLKKTGSALPLEEGKLETRLAPGGAWVGY